ncbi:hypothetical protein CC78DRAFT_528133 [Lojkania enalia]|uniref:Uncharacterized protein n=1 Tax=Lojkania enalia TaxID=147567 RepID=A0A9P4NC46_9PLEO|nr:hypothetical protein CC78DRAFT_528133 [Didymosphaeria enalia]
MGARTASPTRLPNPPPLASLFSLISLGFLHPSSVSVPTSIPWRASFRQPRCGARSKSGVHSPSQRIGRVVARSSVSPISDKPDAVMSTTISLAGVEGQSVYVAVVSHV